MRTLLGVAGLVLATSLVVAQEKTLTPEEALKAPEKTKAILIMEVKSTGKAKTGSPVFLNSEEKFSNNPKNFTVAILKSAVEKLVADKIEDPASHFKGKTVRVEGEITLFNGKPQIAVRDAKQIKIVEKK